MSAITVPAPRPRGRQPGSRLPGSLGGWLATAKPGAVYWTERTMTSLTGEIARSGRTATMKRFYAVSDDLQALRLVRIEVTA